MPFFSIIVPVYNRSKVVEKTLQSLLSQRFLDYELIIVDDGSTDDSYELLEKWRSEKVLIFQKVNGERAAARNFGAKHANGKYFIFFDSDDIMYPDHLSECYHFITENQYPEVVYTGYEFINEKGELLSTVLISNKNFRSKLLRNNFLGCNSVVIRNDIFKKFWFNERRELSTAEDKELWLRVASVYNFHFIPKVTFAMVEHEARSLRNLNVKRIEEIQTSFIEELQHSEVFMQSFKKDYKFLFAYEYSWLSSEWASAGNAAYAFKYLSKALVMSKRVLFTKRFLAALKNYFVLIGKKRK